ncbi:hypothetical protein ACE0DR_04985 [Azotobacter sp. CWF10]
MRSRLSPSVRRAKTAIFHLLSIEPAPVWGGMDFPRLGHRIFDQLQPDELPPLIGILRSPRPVDVPGRAVLPQSVVVGLDVERQGKITCELNIHCIKAATEDVRLKL